MAAVADYSSSEYWVLFLSGFIERGSPMLSTGEVIRGHYKKADTGELTSATLACNVHPVSRT